MSNSNEFSGNAVQAAITALQSGKDVEAAVYGEGYSSAGELGDMPSESFTSSFLDGEEGSQTEATESNPAAPAAKTPPASSKPKGTEDIEEIIFSDNEGRKKVKVDFSNREQVKKYVEMGLGMRKFQAERDKLKGQVEPLTKELADLKSTWSALEDAYSKGGVEGLVNLLQGSPDAYKKHAESEYQRRRAKEDASPAELERMEREEELQRERADKQRLQAEYKQHLDKLKEKEERVEEESTKAVVYPAFNKYRFAGKLNDEALEARLDKAIWTQALSQLSEYSESEITPSLIDKEFRETSAAFRKAVQKQTDTAVKKVMENKKAAAAENAANRASSGMRSNNENDSFKSEIKGGNFTSALQRLMSGKVKL